MQYQPLTHRIFAPFYSNQQKIPAFSLLAGNFNAEAGSQWTASSATEPIDLHVFCEFSVGSKFVRHVRGLVTLHYNGRVPETQNGGLRRAKGRGVSRAHFFEPSHVEHCAGWTWRQAGANPSSCRCSRQSCGRFLESMTSRVGVSSTGCWPTRIARTISGER
jgi:hypothetical protein